MGSAFADFAASARLVIARDMRPSGEALAAAFAEGARARGVEVLDIGLASTDMLYFASGFLDAPGVMFTASHNPAQYNGIKFCLAGARPVGVDSGLAEVAAASRQYAQRPADGPLAALSTVDLSVEWVTHVHSFVDLTELAPLKIVADTANGMGGLVVPLVFDGTAAAGSTSSTPNSTARSRTTRPTRSTPTTWSTCSAGSWRPAPTWGWPSTVTPTGCS